MHRFEGRAVFIGTSAATSLRTPEMAAGKQLLDGRFRDAELQAGAIG